MPTGVGCNLPDEGKMRGIYKLCEVDDQRKAGEVFVWFLTYSCCRELCVRRQVSTHGLGMWCTGGNFLTTQCPAAELWELPQKDQFCGQNLLSMLAEPSRDRLDAENV